jgi:hypothetical protein
LEGLRNYGTFIAWASSVFVLLLFAAPNYCDLCSYRDVKRLIENSRANARIASPDLPPCCAGGRSPGEDRASGDPAERDDSVPAGNGAASHSAVPYCIGSTLFTLTSSYDALSEIRLTIVPSLHLPEKTSLHRLIVVPDHKESRAPPA